MQYRLPPVQNQHAFPNMIPSVNQGSALRGVVPDVSPGLGPRNYTMSPANYVGSTYGVQYPMAYPGGIMSGRPLSGSSGSAPPANSNSPSAASSSVSTSSGSQVEGCWDYFLVFYCLPCFF